MRLVRGNPYVAGVGLLALILVVIVAAASINLSFGLPFNLSPGWPPSQDYTLRAAFTDANGLIKGADVVVAGNRVGQVTGIAIEGRHAVVTMRIKRQYAPLHRGTVAQIRYSTLLAEKYLELTPAAGTPALATGATIPSDETITPVDFDQFLSSLDPQTRSQVRVLVQRLGGGVQGQHAALNDLLDQLSALSVESQPALNTISGRDLQLGSITTNLAIASARLAQSHQQLGDLVASTAIVTSTLLQNDAQLDSLLVHLAHTSGDFDQTLNGNEGNLHDTITQFAPFLVELNGQLTTTYPLLQLSQPQLAQSFNYLTPYVTSAISQQDAGGNYLRQFVVVDLCYDTLNKTKSDPKTGCVNQAVSGLLSPTPAQPAAQSQPQSQSGQQRQATCPSPNPAPPSPTATPCPQMSPAPCRPAGKPPTPTPSPSPTCQAQQGGGGLLGGLGGILGGLLGGGL